MRTVALAIPAASMARCMKSHLRPTDSIRSTWASGRATARARPGKPAPAPTSAIRSAVAQLGDLEAGEAVGDVDLPGALVDDRADRGALLGEQLEDLAPGASRPAGSSAAVGSGAHSETSGATITQRWGSSPSL